MSRTIALGVEYDGSAFSGWQTQPDVLTVQDALEAALGRFLDAPTPTICAGRTDAGVHATHQVVSFTTDAVRAPESWVRALNSFLPRTVAVRWMRPVPDDFHARFSARSRTYEYWILNDPVRSPLYEGRTGWFFRPLDVEAMREGAVHLLGEHDFTSFRAAECQAHSPVRTVEMLEIARTGRLVGIRIRANAFLQHMVRNIVGTLLYVGSGRNAPGWVAEVLAARSRAAAAPTFSPSGLYLTGVGYPDADLPAFGPGPFPWPER